MLYMGRNHISKVRNLMARGKSPSMNILRLASDVADTETVTINGVVFEFDTVPTSVTSGRTSVDVSAGVTPTLAGTALTTAINASSCGMRAVKISASEVLVYSASGSNTAFATTETLAGANNVWAAATAFGGSAQPSEVPVPVILSRVPTATEVTLQTFHFPLNFNPTAVTLQIRTSAGVIRAWDGAITIAANVVSISSSGSTDIAASDVVTILAF